MRVRCTRCWQQYDDRGPHDCKPAAAPPPKPAESEAVLSSAQMTVLGGTSEEFGQHAAAATYRVGAALVSALDRIAKAVEGQGPKPAEELLCDHGYSAGRCPPCHREIVLEAEWRHRNR